MSLVSRRKPSISVRPSLLSALTTEFARVKSALSTKTVNSSGILPPFEALKIARRRGLDLVEVSPTAQPPVCRIQDYGKFLYEKDKSDRAARKKQKSHRGQGSEVFRDR